MGSKTREKRCLVVSLADASGFYRSMQIAKAQRENQRAR